ncbi:MAG: ketopantoate reductase family protein [Pseudomonadales bacterium]
MHTPSPQQHWHILGAGAIGCLMAERLLRAGHHCTLLVRQDHSPRTRTLGCQSLDGAITHYAVETQPASAAQRIANVLLTTKSYQGLHALESLGDALLPDANIIVLQNGMGQHDDILKHFPSCRIFAATTTEGALLEGPLQVKHTGAGEGFIGPLNAPQAALNRLPIDVLQLSATEVIAQLLWRKLVINAAINPLTALQRCYNGELLSNLSYREKLAQLCEEITALIEALAIDILERPLFEQAAEVAQKTATNISSMHQDLRQHRHTEIDYINGYLIKQAKSLDLPCPLNQQLVACIQAQHPGVPHER